MPNSIPLNILVVDDEEGVQVFLHEFLCRLGHNVRTSGNGAAAMVAAREEAPDIALLDIRMPGIDGLSLLGQMHDLCPDTVFIVISAHGNMDSAIQALRLGATDYLQKPIRLTELEVALERCRSILDYRKGQSDDRYPTRTQNSTAGDDEARWLGESPAAVRVRQQLEQLASAGCENILLQGETGAGKEVAVRLLHRMRFTPPAPFVAVNCPAIPDTLVESELFGHRKGAFTGADEDRAGAFELADGGLLFLDEVADLTLAAQAKLLRVLESQTFRRVGGSKDIQVNVTVVAASNRPLELCIQDGAFRSDLYYRLNAFTVEIPPLRERLADLPILSSYFLDLYSERINQEAPEISAEALLVLENYTYPGNVRELRNMMERAAVMAGGRLIGPEHLFFAAPLAPDLEPVEHSPSSSHPELVAVAAKAQNEMEETLQTLRITGWNRSKAARQLGISYEALRWRIRKYDLQQDPQTGSHSL